MTDPLWITNHPHPIKGMWPRRAGVEYFEGEPKATLKYSAEELQAQGLVGVYVNMTRPDYDRLPLVRNPKELVAHPSMC